MKIVLIGTGQVAFILGKKLRDAGNQILEIVGRNAEKGKELANLLHCNYNDNWQRMNDEADCYLLAIHDQAIDQFARDVRLPGKLVAHTAGAVSLAALQKTTDRAGVFYPLQSFKKERADPIAFPVLVEASRPEDLDQLKQLARGISEEVKEAGSTERIKLHVAAVVVNNFTNHLYRLAENFCRQEGLDFQLLLPLLSETATRLKDGSPGEWQTGPAWRGDIQTIEKHLQLLETHPYLKQIYSLFSDQLLTKKQAT